jgi:hypothetical protein
LEQDGGGFVVAILGDEFTFEGSLEDGLAEPGDLRSASSQAARVSKR